MVESLPGLGLISSKGKKEGTESWGEGGREGKKEREGRTRGEGKRERIGRGGERRREGKEDGEGREGKGKWV